MELAGLVDQFRLIVERDEHLRAALTARHDAPSKALVQSVDRRHDRGR
jgi:hypothetical protein